VYNKKKQMNNLSDDQVKQLSSGLYVLDFHADWCGPCRMISPLLEELDTSNPDINFYKVDVDKETELSTLYGIKNIPTVLMVKDGKIIKKVIGASPKLTYESAIRELLDY